MSEHPFPSCIDCKLYKGLCAVHAAQLGRKAGLQSRPFSSPLKPETSARPTSPTEVSPPSSPDKDLESKIKEESAACIDCKIFKTMCGIHLAKLRALSLKISPQPLSPQGPRSPGFYKSSPSVGKNPLKRTTSFTGLSAMRGKTLSASISLDASSFPSPAKDSSSSTTSFSSSSISSKPQEPLPKIKEQQTPVIPEDGHEHCPNCHSVRDIEGALFCGDCGDTFQSTNKNNNTVATTNSIAETVC